MSLFLLILTRTSFLHVCLWWYSFVMIRRRTSGQPSVIIVRVNTLILLVHLDCRPYIFSKSTSGFSSQVRESKSIGQKFCQPNKAHLSFQVKRIVNYFYHEYDVGQWTPPHRQRLVACPHHQQRYHKVTNPHLSTGQRAPARIRFHLLRHLQFACGDIRAKKWV